MRYKQEITILRITGIQTQQQTTEILRQTQHQIHVRIQTQETHKIPADKQLIHNKTTINQIVKTVGLIRLQPEIILRQAEIIRMRQTIQITQVPETIQILQQQINRILQTVRQVQVQTPEEDKN